MAWLGRNSPTAPRRVIAAERRARAVAMRREGKYFSEIGAELGVTTQAASRMVNTALADLAREAHEHTEALRALESERLAEVAMALRPLALQGDVAAAREYRAYSESFRKLWGLDVAKDEQSGPQIQVVIASPPWERGEVIDHDDGGPDEPPALPARAQNAPEAI